jgi:hypothetical protein
MNYKTPIKPLDERKIDSYLTWLEGAPEDRITGIEASHLLRLCTLAKEALLKRQSCIDDMEIPIDA